MNHRYTAEQFALQLGYPNVQAFRYAMQDGHVPPPDGVFAKAPYWNQDTVEKTKTAHTTPSFKASAGRRPSPTLASRNPNRT